MITEPMLAATIKELETAKLSFPLIVTPKLNGWRCLKVDGKVYTRKFKPQPNVYIRETLERILPDGIDGEILIKGGSYNDVQKQVSKRRGEPKFEFHIFDWMSGSLTEAYEDRVTRYNNWWLAEGQNIPYDIVVPVPTKRVKNLTQLLAAEAFYVGQGFEGICLRTPDSPYKCGRSTLREQYLMKYKRFEDSEFEVIGFVELKRNENVAEQDAFGRTKRSKKGAGMVAAETLGCLQVRDINHGWEFEIGTGFTSADKKYIWKNKKIFLGKIGNYKFQKHGMTDRPLAASFQGWRYD